MVNDIQTQASYGSFSKAKEFLNLEKLGHGLNEEKRKFLNIQLLEVKPKVDLLDKKTIEVNNYNTRN